MLKHTFLHIPRVGMATERRLWADGIESWEDALRCYDDRQLGSGGTLIKHYLELSLSAWQRRDFSFFTQLLPASESWRLFPSCSRELAVRIAYLDIETTGMHADYESLTVIGLFDGEQVKYFVQGVNLEHFLDEIEQYELLVTFNGKCFDVPFLRATLPRVRLPRAHIDLRYVLRRLRLSGGLKAIERTAGVARPQDELGQLDGFDAVLLWRLHKRGEPAALSTLLRYNAEDVVGLKPLLELACNRLMAELPL
ncbi:MAG: ribonuclease H-like domain-containing protein, partial [Acidobacteriota bacterium]